MKIVYLILFLFIATHSYADMPPDVCGKISNLSTDCLEIKKQNKFEEVMKEITEKMQSENDYLLAKHNLDKARDGDFSQEPQKIIIEAEPNVRTTMTIGEE